MYTLVIVFWLVSGGSAVAVSTSTVPGYISEAECNQGGQRASINLRPTSQDILRYKYEIKSSCIKTK